MTTPPPMCCANQAIVFGDNRASCGPGRSAWIDSRHVPRATLIYSEALLRHAVFAFWRRSVGVGFSLRSCCALGLGVLVARHGSWIVGTLAAVLVLGIAFVTVVYVVHYRNSLRKFHRWTRLKPRPCRESSFTISSDIGPQRFSGPAAKSCGSSLGYGSCCTPRHSSYVAARVLVAETQAYIVQRVRESAA